MEMGNEGRLREEIARGAKASELLRNEVFLEAFEILRIRYVDAWVNSTTEQVEERERLYVAINVLSEIYEHYENIMKTGEMAGLELDSGAENAPVH